MIKSIQFKSAGSEHYPYGNIKRIGNIQNGRTLYLVTDSSGKEAGKLSIPLDETDTFETAYKDIIDTAPKIQKFAIENSSEKDIKRRRLMSRVLVGAGGVIGATTGLLLTKHSTSTTKKILSTVGGIIAGISAGFISYIAATTPEGTYKFIRATRTFSKLDIKQEG